MALRVLLADESTTIKKVMQLALQDFGVEVKSIPVGLDVIPVAKTFKPDIIFVDVLLQKKSGYEVARDIKRDSELKSLPVVLMWSGFMELDEAKAVESAVNRRLEKPFDAEALRQLIKELVPRTAGNTISNYLNFPKLPDFTEEPSFDPSLGTPEVPQQGLSAAPASAGKAPAASVSADIYSIPDVDENFEMVETPKIQLGEENWSHQDLSKFMVPSGDELNRAQVTSDGDFEEVTFNKREPVTPATAPRVSSAHAPKASGPSSAMDHVMAEKILREEAQAVLEKVLWQILPGICERVVKEELNKLLKDVEGSI